MGDWISPNKEEVWREMIMVRYLVNFKRNEQIFRRLPSTLPKGHQISITPKGVKVSYKGQSKLNKGTYAIIESKSRKQVGLGNYKYRWRLR